MNRKPVILYHVTYSKNLDDISTRGLIPSPVPGLRRGVLGTTAKGVYLTEFDGVMFWYGRAEDWANHDSDNPYEEGLTPVVLAVHTTCKTKVDEVGTRDAGYANAYVCPRPIAPGAIRLWDGRKWGKVRDIDTEKAYDFEPEEACDECEDPSECFHQQTEEGGYWTLKSDYENPLYPQDECPPDVFTW